MCGFGKFGGGDKSLLLLSTDSCGRGSMLCLTVESTRYERINSPHPVDICCLVNCIHLQYLWRYICRLLLVRILIVLADRYGVAPDVYVIFVPCVTLMTFRPFFILLDDRILESLSQWISSLALGNFLPIFPLSYSSYWIFWYKDKWYEKGPQTLQHDYFVSEEGNTLFKLLSKILQCQHESNA